jgi:DNA-3-methyladenine glycosylase I
VSARLAPGLSRDEATGEVRCWWPGEDALYCAYHDREWGLPSSDEVRLFEKLCLEGFQSGLSWLTILRKREAFRRAFAGFDPQAMARFGPRDVERLLQDAGIVRHRGKIEAALNNARRLLELRAAGESLASLVWRHEPDPGERPRRLTQAAMKQLTTSPSAVALSKELKRRGWAFVGPTTVYAFMQSMGLVNDHLEGCAARPRVEAARAAFARPR